VIEPAAPVLAVPVESITEPLFALEEAPLRRFTFPDAPNDCPPWREREPEAPCAEDPDAMAIFPLLPDVAVPDEILTSPEYAPAPPER
jgi:hypothetical protein